LSVKRSPAGNRPSLNRAASVSLQKVNIRFNGSI
jgi:hypothetical protein